MQGQDYQGEECRRRVTQEENEWNFNLWVVNNSSRPVSEVSPQHTTCYTHTRDTHTVCVGVCMCVKSKFDGHVQIPSANEKDGKSWGSKMRRVCVMQRQWAIWAWGWNRPSRRVVWFVVRCFIYTHSPLMLSHKHFTQHPLDLAKGAKLWAMSFYIYLFLYLPLSTFTLVVRGHEHFKQ